MDGGIVLGGLAIPLARHPGRELADIGEDTVAQHKVLPHDAVALFDDGEQGVILDLGTFLDDGVGYVLVAEGVLLGQHLGYVVVVVILGQ